MKSAIFPPVVSTLMAGLLILFSHNLSAQTTTFYSNNLQFFIDEQPRFPSGEDAKTPEEAKQQSAKRLEKFIQDNLKYPESSGGQNFKPVVVRVRITVDSSGKIRSPRILMLGSKEYDANALAVFKKMEQLGILWVPGYSNGKAVSSSITVPIPYTREGRQKAFPHTPPVQEVVYQIEAVDKVPALGDCRQTDKNKDEVKDCSTRYMNNFLSDNMVFSEAAVKAGRGADIQVEFVVGKDGRVQNIVLKNDNGLGYGAETLRLFNLMNEKSIGWIPGEKDGEKVNVLLKTTVYFRFEKEEVPQPEVQPEEPVSADLKTLFKTGKAGYEDFQKAHLEFPKSKAVDPCSFGVIDVKFRINRQTGAVTATETIDYNLLGKEFQTAAFAFIQKTGGQWRVESPNFKADSVYTLSVPFALSGATCLEGTTSKYTQTIYKSLEMATSANAFDEQLAWLNKAVRLYPADNKIRHLRGMALFQSGYTAEGCVDFSFINKQNKYVTVPAACK